MERCPIVEAGEQRERHHQHVSQRVNRRSISSTIRKRYISKHAEVVMIQESREEYHHRNQKRSRCDECILA